jgi:hypothetical protein
MGFISFLNLEAKDIAGFILAGLFGYLAGALMPVGAWSVYTSILVSYHLFLGWLIVTDDRKAAISLPIVSTIATHLACLAIVLPLGMGRNFVPFFGIFRYTIAGLAIFETEWLFGEKSGQPKRQGPSNTTPVAVPVGNSDDYQEWLSYLDQQKTRFRKPGTSLKDEYEQWLIARARHKPVQTANDGNTRIG